MINLITPSASLPAPWALHRVASPAPLTLYVSVAWPSPPWKHLSWASVALRSDWKGSGDSSPPTACSVGCPCKGYEHGFKANKVALKDRTTASMGSTAVTQPAEADPALEDELT